MNEKIRKKEIIMSSVLLILSLFTYFFYHQNQNLDDIYVKIYKQNINSVDDGIHDLMNLKEYKNMEEAKQIQIIRKLLEKYKKNGKIKNLYYDQKGKMYTFQYKDGILGGVMIKPFDPELN